MLDTGTVRLSFEEMQEVTLKHLISGIDEDEPVSGSDGATSTAIGGYTEWISENSPIISLGWDWEMLANEQTIRLRRVSEPRSNVIMMSALRAELGYEKTLTLLETVIDKLAWENETLDYINSRYHPTAPFTLPVIGFPAQRD